MWIRLENEADASVVAAARAELRRVFMAYHTRLDDVMVYVDWDAERGRYRDMNDHVRTESDGPSCMLDTTPRTPTVGSLRVAQGVTDCTGIDPDGTGPLYPDADCRSNCDATDGTAVYQYWTRHFPARATEWCCQLQNVGSSLITI